MSSPIPNRVSSWLKRLTLSAAALAALWLLSSYAVAYQLTRRSAPRCIEATPELAWGKLERVQLQTVDAEEIGAWYIGGRTDGPTVILLHGNGGQKSGCLSEAEFLHASGYNVLLVSLRAHGESSGDCNDFGYSARHDVVAAVQWLEQRDDAGPIVIWGQSLGSAAACFACEELGDRVCGYILECPYRDLHAAVWNRLQARLPPVADHLAYLGLQVVSPLVLADIDRISPCEAISGMPSDMPVLVLAGSEDRRAPVADAVTLCERAGDHAKLITIEGGGHLQLEQKDARIYWGAIFDLLAQAKSSHR
jgi:pimeloyl-ACP methyl ester carboxylesterase